MATLQKVPGLVAARQEFDCNGTLFGYTKGDLYIVYSYGTHFPVAVFKDGGWLVNKDKYSRTTSKHQSKVRQGIGGPLNPEQFRTTEELVEITSASGRQPASYHKIDGWRGYQIPFGAVIGASDTGTWSDSPCPSDKVEAEIKQVQAELRKQGIRSRQKTGQTSNVFCGKRWLCVGPKDWDRAVEIAESFIPRFRFIHDAT
ncbi:hypothetical protein [Rhodoferax mekongensis]|uniref:DUF8033 domain-containing protein n=1 Tax=Rhodoferax mekongensis TaxID=3068341 RepID=A0ABZ0B285_9BURK|nr:hypothetical protein [Rhodoferax sp. TBRC 17307]WNO06030.1 hypothetical protein RAN89_06260 [Rhodoferax sp. TBRC 17307]